MRSSSGDWVVSNEPIEAKTTTLSGGWEPIGYLTGDPLSALYISPVQWENATLPTLSAKQASLRDLQDVVNRAIRDQWQAETHGSFFKPKKVKTDHSVTYTFSSPTMTSPEVMDLFFGFEPDTVEAAVAGQEVSTHTLWKARQERPEEMRRLELAQAYYSGSPIRYACGAP